MEMFSDEKGRFAGFIHGRTVIVRVEPELAVKKNSVNTRGVVPMSLLYFGFNSRKVWKRDCQIL